MNCKWAGSEQPRELPNGDPCPQRHCGTCGHRHVEALTCASCVGEARTDLADIVRMDSQMLTEAVHKGVESEAAMLEGAAANPEAWRQRRRHGFRPHPDDLLGENAPLWVLGTWDLLVTEHYGHKRTRRVTVNRAAKYLGANLTELAQDVDFAFEDLARDLRQCRAHLEAVLHDGEQVERSNVTCIEIGCSANLERLYARTEDHDGWRCSSQRCRAIYDHARYARALHEHLASEGADRWVRISDALAVIARPEMTLRTWVANGEVRSSRTVGGAVYVWWPDVRHKDIASARRSRVHVLK